MNKPNFESHEAYGMITAARVQGNTTLFGVDYPQMHYIELTISRGEIQRDLSEDNFYSGEQLIRVAMSEVQWARMISSMNTQGVPCTLHRYRIGEYVGASMPKETADKSKLFAQEVARTAKEASSSMDDAVAMLTKMLSGSTIKKSDANSLLGYLNAAKRHLEANLPFVVQQAEEAIETAVESGKAEVTAHVDFTMSSLGQRLIKNSGDVDANGLGTLLRALAHNKDGDSNE